MTGEIIGLHHWFDTAPGRYLLAWEQERYDELVADIFGYHALQLGMPGLQALRSNRMPHRWLAVMPPELLLERSDAQEPPALLADAVALPFADKGLDYALQQSASGSSTAMIEQQLGGAFKAFINTSFDMPHVFSLSGSLRGIASAANTYISQMSSYADLPALQQAQSAVGSINLAANVLTIFFVLWIACLAALIAGVVLKFVKKNDVVLIAAFGATAAISLICVIASFVVNGQVESNLVSAFTSMGSSSTAGIIASIKPFIQPAFGAILTLVFAAAGLVCSFVLKED